MSYAREVVRDVAHARDQWTRTRVLEQHPEISQISFPMPLQADEHGEQPWRGLPVRRQGRHQAPSTFPQPDHRLGVRTRHRQYDVRGGSESQHR